MLEVHPYEEVAYYVSRLENENQEVGAGLVGELEEAVEPIQFLQRLKSQMDVSTIRHTQVLDRPVKKIAVCGGAGSFLLPEAIKSKADVFISADFKYHEFFDAEGRLVVADIGHYESEQFTIELLFDIIREKFPNFALHCTELNTNPVHYLL